MEKVKYFPYSYLGSIKQGFSIQCKIKTFMTSSWISKAIEFCLHAFSKKIKNNF